jgi:hypothetical protein
VCGPGIEEGGELVVSNGDAELHRIFCANTGERVQGDEGGRSSAWPPWTNDSWPGVSSGSCGLDSWKSMTSR